MRKQAGQSTTEGVVGLSIFVTFFALLWQVLWILLAQQLMQAATLQAAHVGAATSMNTTAMNVLLYPKLQAIPGSSIHLPRIQRALPTDTAIREFGRYDNERKSYVLAVDFAAVRMSLFRRQQYEEFIKAQVLQVEILYCLPLRIPIAGAIISKLSELSSERLYCNSQALGGFPMLPISTMATVPLTADLWLE